MNWDKLFELLSSRKLSSTGMIILVAGLVATTFAPAEQKQSAIIASSTGFSFLFTHYFFREGVPKLPKKQRGPLTIIVLVILSGLLVVQARAAIKVVSNIIESYKEEKLQRDAGITLVPTSSQPNCPTLRYVRETQVRELDSGDDRGQYVAYAIPIHQGEMISLKMQKSELEGFNEIGLTEANDAFPIAIGFVDQCPTSKRFSTIPDSCITYFGKTVSLDDCDALNADTFFVNMTFPDAGVGTVDPNLGESTCGIDLGDGGVAEPCPIEFRLYR